MQTVTIRTTQNVEVRYPAASLGDRIFAYLIDLAIIIAYFILMLIILVSSEINSGAVFITLLVIPVFLYHVLFEIFMDGQSPGKKQMGIKVVRLDGTPPTIGNYIIRWLLRLVEIDILSGAIAMLTIAVNGRGQRLGDIAAGTAVIKLAKQQEVTASQVFTLAHEDYIPVFHQVDQLTDADIELIHQALELNRTSGNDRPVLAVTEKIKALLGIQSDMPPVKFLYTIVKDYGHITSR